MAKVVFLVGLAGAGKSYLAEQLLKQGTYVYLGEGFHPDFDPRAFRHHLSTLISSLRSGTGSSGFVSPGNVAKTYVGVTGRGSELPDEYRASSQMSSLL